MKANVERWRGVAAWMGMVCLGLLPASSLSAQEPKLRTTLKGHTGAVAGLAFSPDSKTNKERAILTGHIKEDQETSEAVYPVMSAAFSPDGKVLASASYDKPVKLWDVATGTERVTLKGTLAVNSVAFSPDGRMLASACGSIVNAPGELKVWDIATDK